MFGIEEDGVRGCQFIVLLVFPLLLSTPPFFVVVGTMKVLLFAAHGMAPESNRYSVCTIAGYIMHALVSAAFLSKVMLDRETVEQW